MGDRIVLGKLKYYIFMFVTSGNWVYHSYGQYVLGSDSADHLDSEGAYLQPCDE